MGVNYMSFGQVEGIEPGQQFESRQKLYEAGIHRTLQAGIVGRQDHGAESVVLSGGYQDDEDYGDVIIYTGDGGQDTSRKQVADQEFTGKNLALMKNHSDGIPVRVVRGSGHQSEYSPTTGYRYDGVYDVESVWQEHRPHGFKVCRYRLVKHGGSFDELPEHASDDVDEAGPTVRRKTSVNRIVRNRDVADKVKAINNFRCQVCEGFVETAGGPYAEAAHIRPLGRPHDGPDVKSNILCLCPNHHKSFDMGGLFIEDDLTVRGTSLTLITQKAHPISIEHLRYHRTMWGQP